MKLAVIFCAIALFVFEVSARYNPPPTCSCNACNSAGQCISTSDDD